jgi:hypothetical protein
VHTARSNSRLSRLRIVLTTLLSGCSGFALHGSGSSIAPVDQTFRPEVRPAVTRSGTAAAEVRRVCRGARTQGWIAIDYVADSTTCPASITRKQTYSTALIVSLDRIPVGGELAVCADEPVPRDWTSDRTVTDDPRCPTEGLDHPPGREAVKIIRRLR